MKKYIFQLTLLMALSVAAQAQRSQVSPATVAQLKSLAQARMAYNPATGGNEFSTTIITRVTPSLQLSSAQQRSMNTALYNYLTQKSALNKLKWSDPTAYQQQANALLQTFIVQLGTFLSPDQVSKFVAMKPPSARTQDFLVAVFY